MKALKPIALLLVWACILSLSLLVEAQDAPLPQLATVQNNNVWLFGFADAPQQITDGTARGYSDLVWSSDGNYLAFIARDQDYNANLMLYDRVNDALTKVENDIADGFPVRFSFDSGQLFYVKDDPNNGTDPDFKMDFYTYDLVPNATPTQVASFSFGVGCGGGSSFPADWRYWDESSGFGGFHLALEVAMFGLVHSLNCGGSETGLLNLQTGEDMSLGQSSRAVVSPDQTKVAGITDAGGDRTNEKLVVINLQTLQRTELETTGTPDQVAWGALGSSELFYSTRTQGDPITLTAEEQQQLSTVLGYEITVYNYTASIHRFNLETSEDTEIYRADAYAIGRMIPLLDGSALIFSQIPNMAAWAQAVGQGQIDLASPDGQEQQLALVPVQLFRLPLDGGSATVLGADLNQVALYPAQ